MKQKSFLQTSFAILLATSYVLQLAQPSVLRSQTSDTAIISRDSIRTALGVSHHLTTRGSKAEIQESNPLRLVVPFDFNSAELTTSARRQLDELAAALQTPELSQISIELSGHTDARGSAAYNQMLSQRRVERARSYLMKKFRISSKRIEAVGYGETRLLIPNARTEAEHAANRRVEVRRTGTAIYALDLQISDDIVSGPEHNNPKPHLDGVSLQWGVFHVAEDGQQELVQYDGSSMLRSHDAYRIFLRPNVPCYVYLYQVDSQGHGAWLFPREDIDAANPMDSRDHWLPSRNRSFTLDETVGAETIYLVAARQPASDLKDLLSGLANHNAKEVTAIIKTRGLGKIGQGPANSQQKEAMISITNKSSEHIKTGPGLERTHGVSREQIAETMSRTGEFYVVLNFEHNAR